MVDVEDIRKKNLPTNLYNRFYKRRGLKLRARRQFEEALTVVPDHAAALEELKALD